MGLAFWVGFLRILWMLLFLAIPALVLVAAEIMRFDEVQTVWLMSSSSYDLSVIIRGHSFKDISMFVAKRLATLDSVTSTATNFVLKRYKEHFFTFEDEIKDERRHLNID